MGIALGLGLGLTSNKRASGGGGGGAVSVNATGPLATASAGSITASITTALAVDTSAHTPPTVDARPAYLTPYTDPTYGVQITRITNDPSTTITGTADTWGDNVHQDYMRWSMWNADETMMVIRWNSGTGGSGNLVFLDGSTYAPLYVRTPPASGNEMRWDKLDATRLVWCNGTSLNYYTPSTNSSALIRSFTGTYTGLTLNYGETSYDNDIVPLTGTRTSDSHVVAFAYKISTNTINTNIDITALTKTLVGGTTTISPDGAYIYLYFTDDTSAVYTAAGALVAAYSATKQPQNFSMVVDEYGEACAVGSNANVNGHVIKRRMSDGAIFEINPASFAYTTSASNWKVTNSITAPGWVVSDYYFDSGSPYVSELAISSLDGQMVGRIAHNQRGTNIDGENAPISNMSPTGKRIAFASTWRGSGTPSRPVGVYVADFRNFNMPILPDLVSNGGVVANSTGWTLNTGWARVGSVLTHTAGNVGVASPTLTTALVNGATYKVQYTITAVSASNVAVRLSGATPVVGTSRSAVGTYTETLVNSSANTVLDFLPNTLFAGSIDNVKLWRTA